MKSTFFTRLALGALLTFGVFCAFCGTSSAAETGESAVLFAIDSFTVDELPAPQGIDDPRPHFGWRYQAPVAADGADAVNNQTQSAYQLVLRNSPAGDEILWTSGKVESDQQTFVPYTGADLAPGTAYLIDLTVWNEDGTLTDTITSTFSTGLWPTDADPNPWKGKWIDKSESEAKPDLPARYLSKKASVASPTRKPILRATAYIAGLGYNELYIAGEKVGDHVLDPIYTDFEKRVAYNTFDVTDLMTRVQSGAFEAENPDEVEAVDYPVGVILGNGRYYAPREPRADRAPRLLFQMVVEYADGSSDLVVSDESWKMSADGPIQGNNDFDGEICDMRRAVTLEQAAADPDGDYFLEESELVSYAVPTPDAVEVLEAPAGKLVAQMMPPMRVNDLIRPVSISEYKPNVYIVDFGQNFVGWVWMKVAGPAGTEVTLRHAETLIPDGENAGDLYTANLRYAKARDIYTLRDSGGAPQYYRPRFTYHGFRYLKIEGYPGRPTLDDFTGCVVGTDLAPVGRFRTSCEIINRIYHNIFWGTRGNYLSMPTDCPQRDERQGWQGDRAAESKGEMFLFDNITLYRKWMQDIEDSQRDDGNVSDVAPNYWPLYNTNVTWPSAQFLVPESIWLMYGDTSAIAKHFDSRKKWLDHIATFIKPDGTVDKDNYGDWCVPPERPELIHSEDAARRTNQGLLATSYYFKDLELSAQFADMLGRTDDAAELRGRAEAAKTAFNNVYYNAAEGKYDNGTQTSSALPLAFGLVPDGDEPKVFATLVNNIENVTDRHIGTGLIGGQWINRVLSAGGRDDLAYTFTTNTTYPSWGYMVEKGATTVWELWNGDTADPAMNSGNHVMLVGDLAIWYYEYLAGIQADSANPGFKHILMAPHVVGDLTMVDAAYDSIRGRIASAWTAENGVFTWTVLVPVNASATASVPTSDPASVRVENAAGGDAGLRGTETDGRVEFEIGSGVWKFTSKL
ncbi:MAG: family 78 glycoside hydrolase catalytic domain [Thermoguttaceae bacterium]|nr:family 78 glycoside hydrolase catalytic domain [Thermoguttaceae bacterium]